MRKSRLLTAILIITSVFLTLSCGGEVRQNSSPETPPYGTWSYNNSYFIAGRTLTETLTLKADLKYSSVARFDDDHTLLAENHGTFTWGKGQIIYTSSIGTVTKESYTVISNTLVIVYPNGSTKTWRAVR